MLLEADAQHRGNGGGTPVIAVVVDESLSMAYPDARQHPLVPVAGNAAERELPLPWPRGDDAARRADGPEQGTSCRRLQVLRQRRTYRRGGGKNGVWEIRQLPEPTGTHSSPGDALVDVVRDLAGSKVAGVVLDLRWPVDHDAAVGRHARRGGPAAEAPASPSARDRDGHRGAAPRPGLVDLAAPKEANPEDTPDDAAHDRQSHRAGSADRPHGARKTASRRSFARSAFNAGPKRHHRLVDR